ncbi:MAG: hypothetical protein LBB60_10515 [Desulfovibrio sp.]|jgi:hypothetical protein|nr:hypothetical protein [Desulfovibrio sp.]
MQDKYLLAIGNGNLLTGMELVRDLAREIEFARAKHPVFAEGIYQALGRVGAEYGELVQAVEKGMPQEETAKEAMHLIVTAVRMLNGEHGKCLD